MQRRIGGTNDALAPAVHFSLLESSRTVDKIYRMNRIASTPVSRFIVNLVNPVDSYLRAGALNRGIDFATVKSSMD